MARLAALEKIHRDATLNRVPVGISRRELGECRARNVDRGWLTILERPHVRHDVSDVLVGVLVGEVGHRRKAESVFGDSEQLRVTFLHDIVTRQVCRGWVRGIVMVRYGR
jgi:hypothetical protein